MNWKTWLKGLLAAVVGGVVTAASTYVTGGSAINGKAFIGVVVTGAVVGLGMYLKQSPIDKAL